MIRKDKVIPAFSDLTLDDEMLNYDQVHAYELFGMLDVCTAVVKAALMRTESRGAHFRSDYPDCNNSDWLKHIVVKREDGRLLLRTEPVQGSNVTLPEGSDCG